MSMKLSDKQKAFCREYVLDYNASAAYVRAGYSKKGNNVSSSQLLAKPSIKEYIAKLQEKVEVKFTTTLDEVLARVNKIGMDDEHKDQLKANDMLVKTLGGYTEKLDIVSKQEVRYYAPEKSEDV